MYRPFSVPIIVGDDWLVLRELVDERRAWRTEPLISKSLVLVFAITSALVFAQQPVEFEYDHALSAAYPIVMEEAAVLGYMLAAIDDGGETGPAILSLESSAVSHPVSLTESHPNSRRRRRTGLDLVTDASLREEARAFFLEKTGGDPRGSSTATPGAKVPALSGSWCQRLDPGLVTRPAKPRNA